MATKMLLYRGDAADWVSANPTPASGELGAELDTQIVRAGDGATPWNSLPIPFIEKGIVTTKGDLIVASDVGTASRLGKGTTGQRLTVESDGSLGWTDKPELPTLETAVHAEATYKILTDATAEHALLETISGAAATYETAATAATDHATFETLTAMSATYLTKATALTSYESKWTTKVKAATTNRTGVTALAADPDLFFVMVSGKTYYYELNLFYTGVAAADILLSMGPTANASSWHAGFHILGQGLSSGSVEFIPFSITMGSGSNEHYTQLAAGTSDATPVYGSAKGLVVASANGNFGLMWAQNASSAGIGTNLLAGSYLRSRQIA